MQSTKYLSFDIETAKIIDTDFSQWKKFRPIGIICAATKRDNEYPLVWYSRDSDDNVSKKMTKEDLCKLINYLEEKIEEGYQLLTWNGLGFDFDVLAEESGEWERCSEIALNHTDMMFDFFCRVGYPIGLDKAAKCMGLKGKTEGVSGDQAPILWKQGNFETVLAYVAQDAVTTLEIAIKTEYVGRISWITQRGNRKDLSLQGRWLSCNEAISLPIPDVSWMSNPIRRQDFLDWIIKRPVSNPKDTQENDNLLDSGIQTKSQNPSLSEDEINRIFSDNENLESNFDFEYEILTISTSLLRDTIVDECPCPICQSIPNNDLLFKLLYDEDREEIEKAKYYYDDYD
jgi:hypothetical protein